MSGLKPVLARLGRGETLSATEAAAAFGLIMDGAASEAQIAGLLMAMRARGETVAELTGAVTAMRARMLPVEIPPGAIDVCGTGGDAALSLNVSTAVTFVLAACGVPVAKHGNRALSSRAGGADVLGALGVGLEPPLGRLAEILAEVGCVFLFAPRHHLALRHAARVRAELGTRTILNLTGPLSNPAGVTRQLVGVYDPAWSLPVAETLRALGTEAAWIVHGGGLDELTLAGPNDVVSLRDGAISRFTLEAADAGLPTVPLSDIAGGDAAYNAAALRAVLGGARNGYRDTVLFNAAAALIVAGVTTSLTDGVARAAASLDDGAALRVLERLAAATALSPV
jgi:anthranilate phosphoribosyltransferase/anthranilate synthase/phosphoribosyltransferase